MNGAAAPRSLRSRLTRALLVRLALVLVAGGAAAYFALRTVLTEQFDAALAARARGVAAAFKLEFAQPADRVEFDLVAEALPEYSIAGTLDDGPEYFQVLAMPGQEVVQRSPSLADGRLALEHDGPEGRSDLRLPDGRRGRAAWITHVPPYDAEHAPPESIDERARAPRLLIAVARARAPLDLRLRQALSALLVIGGLMLVGGWLAARVAVRSGLAPLDLLARKVAAIDPANVPERLDAPPSPGEIDAVRRRLDELLLRLRDAMERERRFSAAAAHELRTPLAELRAIIDVRLKWPDSMHACEQSLREARTITMRMEQVVAALLALARSQSGPLVRSPVTALDLAGIVRDATARIAGTAAQRGVTVEAAAPPVAVCQSDPAAVRTILDNLLSNAVAYTRERGRITVELRTEEGHVVVSIRNGPTDLSPDDQTRMTEPFWRKDASRRLETDDARPTPLHLGLGLTIASGTAELIGSRLKLAVETDSCVVAELRLSRARD